MIKNELYKKLNVEQRAQVDTLSKCLREELRISGEQTLVISPGLPTLMIECTGGKLFSTNITLESLQG